MSDHRLPNSIDPFKLIDTGVELIGQVDLSRLSRMDGLLASMDGAVDVKLNFFRDDQKLAIVHGLITTDLLLTCQRCLGDSELAVDMQFKLALVRQESDIDDLPDCYEPWVLTKPSLDLFHLVEEELILALPIVHFHEEQCVEVNSQEKGKAEEKVNPFAVLAELKEESK